MSAYGRAYDRVALVDYALHELVVHLADGLSRYLQVIFTLLLKQAVQVSLFGQGLSGSCRLVFFHHSC